jgi:hypothetical protein
MKSSNKFYITQREEENKFGWPCCTCGIVMFPPFLQYVITPSSKGIVGAAWACSEECTNMYILSKI